MSPIVFGDDFWKESTFRFLFLNSKLKVSLSCTVLYVIFSMELELNEVK